MNDPKQYLTDQINAALKHDRTGDVTLRDQIVQRLLNEECGFPLAYIQAAMWNVIEALLARKAGETIPAAVERWVHEHAAASGMDAEQVAAALAIEGSDESDDA
jgi:hypothetical protein